MPHVRVVTVAQHGELVTRRPHCALRTAGVTTRGWGLVTGLHFRSIGDILDETNFSCIIGKQPKRDSTPQEWFWLVLHQTPHEPIENYAILFHKVLFDSVEQFGVHREYRNAKTHYTHQGSQSYAGVSSSCENNHSELVCSKLRASSYRKAWRGSCQDTIIHLSDCQWMLLIILRTLFLPASWLSSHNLNSVRFINHLSVYLIRSTNIFVIWMFWMSWKCLNCNNMCPKYECSKVIFSKKMRLEKQL